MKGEGRGESRRACRRRDGLEPRCGAREREQEHRTYVEKADLETAANALLCLIHQANFLLDRQLRVLEGEFLAKGGFTERLYRMRSERRGGSLREALADYGCFGADHPEAAPE